MRKFGLMLAVLGVVAAVGYLLGTEGGRARRDDMLRRVRKTADGVEEIDLREDTELVSADA